MQPQPRRRHTTRTPHKTDARGTWTTEPPHTPCYAPLPFLPSKDASWELLGEKLFSLWLEIQQRAIRISVEPWTLGLQFLTHERPEVSTACLEDTHSGPTTLPWGERALRPLSHPTGAPPSMLQGWRGAVGSGWPVQNEQSQLTLLLSKSHVYVFVSSASLTISAGLWGEKTPHAGFSQSQPRHGPSKLQSVGETLWLPDACMGRDKSHPLSHRGLFPPRIASALHVYLWLRQRMPTSVIKLLGKNVNLGLPKCLLGKKERLVTADPLQFPAYPWGPWTAPSSGSKRLPGPAASKAVGTLRCVGTFLVVMACWQKAKSCCSQCPGVSLCSGKIVCSGVKNQRLPWGLLGQTRASQSQSARRVQPLVLPRPQRQKGHVVKCTLAFEASAWTGRMSSGTAGHVATPDLKWVDEWSDWC